MSKVLNLTLSGIAVAVAVVRGFCVAGCCGGGRGRGGTPAGRLSEKKIEFFTPAGRLSEKKNRVFFEKSGNQKIVKVEGKLTKTSFWGNHFGPFLNRFGPF